MILTRTIIIVFPDISLGMRKRLYTVLGWDVLGWHPLRPLGSWALLGKSFGHRGCTTPYIPPHGSVLISILVQVTNKKRQQLQESQSSSVGEVIDGEPDELLEETLVEEEEEEEGHLERAVFALDLADRDRSGSETGVEEFEVVLPQPRKERRRWDILWVLVGGGRKKKYQRSFFRWQ